MVKTEDVASPTELPATAVVKKEPVDQDHGKQWENENKRNIVQRTSEGPKYPEAFMP